LVVASAGSSQGVADMGFCAPHGVNVNCSREGVDAVVVLVTLAVGSSMEAAEARRRGCAWFLWW
jgi:hypothetical protein